MPSLDLWRQIIDDAAIRQGVFVNNTANFWEWMQVVHFKRPKSEFSEKIANEILDQIGPLVTAYHEWQDKKAK
jgi:hypothetical protein